MSAHSSTAHEPDGTNPDSDRGEQPRQPHTRILDLLFQIAVAANEAATLEDALRSAIDPICVQFGWALGHAYVVAEDSPEELAPTLIWYSDPIGRIAVFQEATTSLRFARGIGLPGQVLATGQPVWIPDVTTDPGFLRATPARIAGIKAGLGVPVRIGAEVVAVLEFFATQVRIPDAEMLEVLELISIQFGRVVERQRERRAIEQARALAEGANAAKSEFLSRMSHELRTPLNAILGFGQLLQMDNLTPRQQENVGHILRGGQHLLALINDVLDLARIEAGRSPLAVEPIAVSEIVAEALDLIQPLAAQHNIPVGLARGLTETSFVLADRQRLRQVLLNLLANAVKYNRADGRVTVSWEQRVDGRLRIGVADTGRGIPQEQRGRLFTPFERLNAEHSSIEGTGLGLALTRTLVEAMGGQIGVESDVGVGSTFWIDVPLAAEPSEYAQTAGAARISLPLLPRRCTLLAIEDNAVNALLVERFCATWPDLQLLTAATGQGGLALAQTQRPDLILLDVQLPDLDGDEVLRRLQRDPVTRAIPVVIVSANAMLAHIERFMAAGVRAYLTKPLDLQRLRAVIDEVLRSA